MKTSIIITAAMSAALLLASCAKNNSDISVDAGLNELKINFPGVNVPTKVGLGTDETNAESTVQDIQVLVFDNAGRLELFEKMSGTSGKVKVTKGQKTVLAIANYSGDLSSSTSVSDVYNNVTKLNDNIIDGTALFVMSGEEDNVNVDGPKTVNITLERIASKFIIKEVTVSLNSAFSASDLTIDRIYLDNAVINATLGGGKTSLGIDDFVNKRGGFDDSGHYQAWSATIYDSWTMWAPSEGEARNGQKLYAYPNNIANNADSRNKTGAFTVRKTRLIVEATLKGKKTFYPYTFDGNIERNHYYEISNLTITGYGVDHPEDPTPEKAEMTVSVEVKKWEKGGSTSIEI